MWGVESVTARRRRAAARRQDAAAAAVGGGSRAAPAHQGAVRRRGGARVAHPQSAVWVTGDAPVTQATTTTDEADASAVEGP